MEKGTCKLCLEETELCNSHIIPEFAYKPLYVPYKISDRRLLKLSFIKGAELELTHFKKGLREYLLCKNCENKLSLYENYAKNTLLNIFSYNLIEYIDVEVDYFKFKMFELSILWRCGITSIANFRINLGDKHLEMIRKVLHENKVINFWQYGCIKLVIHSNEEIIYDLIMTIEGNRYNGLRIYGIYFYGVQWTFIVGSENHRILDDKIEEGYLLSNGNLKIVRQELSNSTFLMNLAKHIYT